MSSLRNEITTAAHSLGRAVEAPIATQADQDAQDEARKALASVLAAGEALGMEFGPRLKGLAQ